MINKISFLFLVGSIFCLQVLGQDVGIIVGKVTEAESGFEVIGGNVVISGTINGASTALDGTYTLKVEPGTYDIECSYLGFQTQKITGVVVASGEVVNLDLQLEEKAMDLDVVTVVAKAARNTESSVIALQKASPKLISGISASQIKKSGDGDVAQAVKRITGVTIEDGKYVYVRGLGDRYSKTTLNKAEIPGLDPNRNTVQMDLFPTQLVDNIIVYKTFSPELPGDFTGGMVEITTKDFPETFNLGASISMGYNPSNNFNKNTFSYDGSSRDWLGQDDGLRALPDAIGNYEGTLTDYTFGLNDVEKAKEVEALTKSFDNNWQMKQEAKPLDMGFGLNIGNQKSLFGKPLGLVASLTYARTYQGYQNGELGIYELTGNVESTNGLTPQIRLADNKGVEETLWGALFSASYKLSANHRITLTGIHNQSGTSTAKYSMGNKFRDDADDIFETRTWRYLERSLSTAQISGEHLLNNATKIKLKWLSSYSVSQQDDPDLRFFTNRVNTITNKPFIKPSSDNVPTRFYRNMQQDNWDTKVYLSMPFKQWNGLSSEFKMGGSYVFKDRSFRETRYNFNNISSALPLPDKVSLEMPLLDMSFYFDDDNTIKATDEGYTNGGRGVYVSDNYSAKNNYNADQAVAAAFAMVDLPFTDQLRGIVGVRVEQASLRLETFDQEATLDRYPALDGQEKILNNLDLLPSLTLNYDLTENQKLRFALSRTIARPTFRELAPFASFDTDGGYIFVGNPDLQRTTIDNIDLRWESYPKSGENLSFGVFAKKFNQPIERTYNPEAGNTEITVRNVDQAYLLGTEIEFRKNLSFIADKLTNFNFSTNFSYIYSKTDIDQKELENMLASDSNAASSREMFGQAPYVFNALLNYKNNNGFSTNLSFNIVGDRISLIAIGATPNYYLKAFPSLNFNISKKLANNWTLSGRVRNMLNAKYQEVVTFKGTDYAVQTYSPGVGVSIGLSYNFTK